METLHCELLVVLHINLVKKMKMSSVTIEAVLLLLISVLWSAFISDLIHGIKATSLVEWNLSIYILNESDEGKIVENLSRVGIFYKFVFILFISN